MKFKTFTNKSEQSHDFLNNEWLRGKQTFTYYTQGRDCECFHSFASNSLCYLFVLAERGLGDPSLCEDS